MSRSPRTLFWLVAVLVLSALVLSFLERRQERREYQATEETPMAKVMLIAYEGEPFPGIEQSGSYLRLGCRDMLVPQEIPVVSRRFPSVLTALASFEPPQGLHNPLKEQGILFRELTEDARGKTIIFLEGHPSFGGICDTPRFKGQLEETVKLYAKKFEIRLNGEEAHYRCIDDLSGECR